MSQEKILIIAEAGVNHNGSMDLAKELIDIAAQAGADIVKFQTFSADKLAVKSAPKADYQKSTTGNQETQYEMLKKLELSPRQFKELRDYCDKVGIEFLSTPFDSDSLKFLVNDVGMSRIKIPSGEVTNLPFILDIARTGKDIILSSGMCSLGDIEEALMVIAFGALGITEPPSREAFGRALSSPEGQQILRKKVTLLHCTTEYPAPIADVNLLAMRTLREAFGLPVGYSDHTEGITVPTAAAALGASVIEKHFTKSRTLPGPDHRASLEPSELSEMVKSIRIATLSLGNGFKVPAASELKNRKIARKVIVATRKIRIDEPFTHESLTVKRAESGLPPSYYWEVLGKPARREIQVDEPVTFGDLG
jgi:N-acetylneuraminate synthase